MTTLHTPAEPINPSARFTAPTEAAPAQVRRWLASGEIVLIDVRQTDEHAREHIAGSILMPLATFDPSKAAALAAPGQRIIIHCRGGTRSAEACRSATGFTSMTGGIEAWKAAGFPVIVNKQAARISVMRQVQLVIGLGVLAGSALAYFVHPTFVGIPAFFGAGLTFAGASGTCALATLLGMMPWNKSSLAAMPSTSCAPGRCG